MDRRYRQTARMGKKIGSISALSNIRCQISTRRLFMDQKEISDIVKANSLALIYSRTEGKIDLFLFSFFLQMFLFVGRKTRNESTDETNV